MRLSALDHVDGKAATRCLLVLALHICPGLAHGRNDLIKGDLVDAVAAEGETGRIDGLHAADSVSLYTGNLHQAADRVARESEVVLHADFRGVFHLGWRTSEHLCQPCGRAIAQAEPTSPWQPTSAPEMDAFSLIKMPMAAAVSMKRTMPSSLADGTNLL